jgi:hypothetical protein
MSTLRIKLIIVLMTLALIGLLGFQWYWINNAIKINKEQFKTDVHQVLNQVAEKLEKQEALFLIYNQYEQKFLKDTLGFLGKKLIFSEDPFFQINDSTFYTKKGDQPIKVKFLNHDKNPPLNLEKLKDNGKIKSISITSLPELKDIDSSFLTRQTQVKGKGPNEYLVVSGNIKPNGKPSINKIHDQVKFEQSAGNEEISSFSTDEPQNASSAIKNRFNNLKGQPEQVLKAVKSTEMVTVVLEEFLKGTKRADFIDPILIDSLIKEGLYSKGIDLNYEFGVYEKLKDS